MTDKRKREVLSSVRKVIDSGAAPGFCGAVVMFREWDQPEFK